MGIKCDNLKEIFTFTYYINFGDITENEFDHVFTGQFDGNPKPNKKEAADWKWINIQELKQDITQHPRNYAYWLPIILNKL